MRDKLQQFDKQGVHKLVLDLRDCARGPASEGIAAAQLLIPSGTIAMLKGQTVSRQEFDADPDKVVWHGPVEVLISPSTSGAAEILAAAIGDDHRGDFVGMRTFGTASEQKLIPLEDGSAIILTVAYYYTPANKSILENGVAPSVEVVGMFRRKSEATIPLPPRSAPINCRPRMIRSFARLSTCSITAPARPPSKAVALHRVSG